MCSNIDLLLIKNIPPWIIHTLTQGPGRNHYLCCLNEAPRRHQRWQQIITFHRLKLSYVWEVLRCTHRRCSHELANAMMNRKNDISPANMARSAIHSELNNLNGNVILSSVRRKFEAFFLMFQSVTSWLQGCLWRFDMWHVRLDSN